MADFKPSKPASKFDWTKIHLVYLALAGFDLAAIGAGLTLSEWSKSAHQETIERVTETNLLRNHLFGMQEFAIKVGAIQDTVYVDRKTVAAQIELESRNSIFKLIFSDKALETKLSTSTKAMNGGAENVLRHIDPEALQSFRIAETEIRHQVEIMITETAKTIAALKMATHLYLHLVLTKPMKHLSKV